MSYVYENIIKKLVKAKTEQETQTLLEQIKNVKKKQLMFENETIGNGWFYIIPNDQLKIRRLTDYLENPTKEGWGVKMNIHWGSNKNTWKNLKCTGDLGSLVSNLMKQKEIERLEQTNPWTYRLVICCMAKDVVAIMQNTIIKNVIDKQAWNDLVHWDIKSECPFEIKEED